MQNLISTIWEYARKLSISFLFVENVALGKQAEQSGTAPGTRYATADKAVDGDTNPEMSHGSCVNVRRSNNKPAWWQVDLGQEYDIAQVKIFTRNAYRGMFIFLY